MNANNCGCKHPRPSGRIYKQREACRACGLLFDAEVAAPLRTRKFYGLDRTGRAVTGPFRKLPR